MTISTVHVHRAVAFRHVKVGDTVRLTPEDGSAVLEFKVAGASSSTRYGAFLRSEAILSADGVDSDVVYERDGWLAEVTAYADGLPEAPALVWNDADRNPHIAYCDGPRRNGRWLVDGHKMDADELLAFIGRDMDHVEPLDWRIA
ncbi:hypothetical protein GCM10025867_49500 (plasmid) [Frondihabitans sucicola]|uniref:Uncharacterized protein n=1 Tax=Frondihabitans sucicola TaxID=1268041 RepID=A0ABM8GWB0_9MICO|nr:hypothetical protein [Frondihabitans sucicola]BDZ52709.1 hypothetical protein GCM10025867_49500 [Frondihabitans sucicola]